MLRHDDGVLEDTYEIGPDRVDRSPTHTETGVEAFIGDGGKNAIGTYTLTGRTSTGVMMEGRRVE